jgi:hypothetical protein
MAFSAGTRAVDFFLGFGTSDFSRFVLPISSISSKVPEEKNRIRLSAWSCGHDCCVPVTSKRSQSLTKFPDRLSVNRGVI